MKRLQNNNKKEAKFIIKKFIMLVACLLFFVLISPNESNAANFREVKQLSANTYLRVAASPSANTVTTLSKNTIVTQFNTVAGGWSYIQANQYKGYVPTSSLKTPTSSIKIASSRSGLVVKETASRNAKTVATLKYNMIVEDFGSVGGGWSFVQYGNVTGYVSTSFISNAKTTTKYVNGSGNYIVRNIASPSGAQKGTVKGGTAVTEHSQIAGWSYISSGSLRGYIQTNQLTAQKATAQTATVQKLTTFTHLRPSNITWSKFYMDMVDGQGSVYSGYLESFGSDNHYGYETSNYVGAYYSYSPTGFRMGAPSSDWTWVSMDAPMTQNQATPDYYYEDYDNTKKVYIGNYFLRTTTGTLTTPAGTFKNVVHIEQKLYSSSTSYHYYFSPGYGLIKIASSTGELLFELRDYY